MSTQSFLHCLTSVLGTHRGFESIMRTILDQLFHFRFSYIDNRGSFLYAFLILICSVNSNRLESAHTNCLILLTMTPLQKHCNLIKYSETLLKEHLPQKIKATSLLRLHSHILVFQLCSTFQLDSEITLLLRPIFLRLSPVVEVSLYGGRINSHTVEVTCNLPNYV